MKNQAPERRPGAILSEHSFPDLIPGSGFSAIPKSNPVFARLIVQNCNNQLHRPSNANTSLKKGIKE